jgi:uncharacterized Tic20 family protein
MPGGRPGACRDDRCCTPPAPNGRLHDGTIDATDRNFAVAMHLSPFAGVVFAPLFLAPLVLWLIRREASPFSDDHGREVVNFCVSVTIWHVVTAATIIGFVLWPVLWIIVGVSLIRGACAASAGTYFRYPMTIRFI